MIAEQRAPIFPVLLINFIGALGFSIVLPFLVFLVTRFGGDAIVYGLMGATYPVFQLVGAPILGRWSDKVGRKRVLLLSQAGTLLAWCVFLVALFLPPIPVLQATGLVLSLPLVVLFLARALDGLTGGNISVAHAYLADITREEDRSANFGKLSISSNLGFVLGPALAGLLGGTVWGETLPVLAALLISLVGTVLVAFYLPESNPCVPPPDLEVNGIRKVMGQELADCIPAGGADVGLRGMLRFPGVAYMLALYLVLFMGFNLFYTAFPVHAVSGLGWTLQETGLFFSSLSLMMVIVQGPVLHRLSRRFSDASLVVVGNLILGANFALLYVADTGLAFVAAALFAIGNGLMWPSFLSVLSRVAGSEHQGAVQGLASSVGALASILGLVAGGFAYQRVGPGTFLLAAALIELAFLMSFRLLRFGVGPRETSLVDVAERA